MILGGICLPVPLLYILKLGVRSNGSTAVSLSNVTVNSYLVDIKHLRNQTGHSSYSCTRGMSYRNSNFCAVELGFKKRCPFRRDPAHDLLRGGYGC